MWLNQVFEDKRPSDGGESKMETKEEIRKRVQKLKIKKNLIEQAKLKK